MMSCSTYLTKKKRKGYLTRKEWKKYKRLFIKDMKGLLRAWILNPNIDYFDSVKLYEDQLRLVNIEIKKGEAG